MVELRRDAESIIRQVKGGQAMILTYRGQPVLRLQPLDTEPGAGDPFYDLHRLAVDEGKSLSNEDVDRLLYG